MDGEAWKAIVHGVAESQTRLSNFTFTFHFHALEKAMATHSSVLAWRIPGTGAPGGLPSMGSHRVGHDWSDLAAVQIDCGWLQSSLLIVSLIWKLKGKDSFGEVGWKAQCCDFLSLSNTCSTHGREVRYVPWAFSSSRRQYHTVCQGRVIACWIHRFVCFFFSKSECEQ